MTEIFAHRGLHRDVTENTVEAFLAARGVGADGVELDIRRTRDGALVVHHDPHIDGLGLISELACRDLPESVASFAAAMNACLGLKVNVEIKNIPTEAGYDASGSLAHQVVRELADLAFPDDIIISSFDLATCDMVRAADGDLAVGWLLHWALETGPCIVEAAEHGLQAVHPYFVRVKRDDVDTAHTRGIAVNVWTVNEKSDISAMLELGVDTIITDDPALALATASRPAHG